MLIKLAHGSAGGIGGLLGKNVALMKRQPRPELILGFLGKAEDFNSANAQADGTSRGALQHDE